MLKLKHWVVIRYNIGLYDQRAAIAEKWMEERLGLYTNYTYKSLKNQSNRNFSLILLFDSKTPSEEIQKIPQLHDIDTRIHAIQYPDKDMIYKESHLQRIDFSRVEKIFNESKFSIQTRIDNDDAFYPTAINAIYNAVTIGRDCAIDIDRGTVLDVEHKKAYHADHYFGSPFISLYQHNDGNQRFIYSCQHKQIANRMMRVSIDSPLWVMVVHENNISNNVFDWMHPVEYNYDKALIETGMG